MPDRQPSSATRQKSCLIGLRSPDSYSQRTWGMQMEVLLYRLRQSEFEAPLFLAELVCHYERDFTGSLGIFIRQVFADQFARDHEHRQPAVVDPERYHPPVRSVIYLRKDESLTAGVDVDREHGFVVHIVPPRWELEIIYVFPAEKQYSIKGQSVMILKPGNSLPWSLEHFPGDIRL